MRLQDYVLRPTGFDDEIGEIRLGCSYFNCCAIILHEGKYGDPIFRGAKNKMENNRSNYFFPSAVVVISAKLRHEI